MTASGNVGTVIHWQFLADPRRSATYHAVPRLAYSGPSRNRSSRSRDPKRFRRPRMTLLEKKSLEAGLPTLLKRLRSERAPDADELAVTRPGSDWLTGTEEKMGDPRISPRAAFDPFFAGGEWRLSGFITCVSDRCNASAGKSPSRYAKPPIRSLP